METKNALSFSRSAAGTAADEKSGVSSLLSRQGAFYAMPFTLGVWLSTNNSLIQLRSTEVFRIRNAEYMVRLGVICVCREVQRPF